MLLISFIEVIPSWLVRIFQSFYSPFQRDLYTCFFFFFYKDENESTKPRKEKHALFDYYYY